MYCTCQVSNTPVPVTLLLCWEWITKLTGISGTIFQDLPGPVTQVAASVLLLYLHWLPALMQMGSGIWGLAPGLVTSGLSKSHLLSRGWLWG